MDRVVSAVEKALNPYHLLIEKVSLPLLGRLQTRLAEISSRQMGIIVSILSCCRNSSVCSSVANGYALADEILDIDEAGLFYELLQNITSLDIAKVKDIISHHVKHEAEYYIVKPEFGTIAFVESVL